MVKKFAVIGNPINQSRSPEIHKLFADQFSHKIEYTKLLATADTFEAKVLDFARDGAIGMNVTAPFKLAAAQLSKSLSARAKSADAVNTLLFKGEKIYGDNTDGIGLVRDIQENLGFILKNKRILLIGAGGAARGILLPIFDTAPASILIINRTAEKAEQLADTMRIHGNITGGAFASAQNKEFDLVINATSAGLSASSLPPINYNFSNTSLAYDLVYSAKATAFMQQAKVAGAKLISDGLGMLIEQAAFSYKFWHGVMPDTKPVLQHLRASLV